MDINGNPILNEGYFSKEKKALSELRAKVSSDSKISRYDLDDAFLLKFLRARNHDPKVALGLVKNYIAMVRSKPNLFAWSDGIKETMEKGLYVNYQHKTPKGERIIIIQPGLWDPKKTKFEDLIRASLFVLELMLMDEDVQHKGFVILVDVHGVGLYHIYQMGITNAMILSQLTDQCMPIKIINSHVCFQNRLTDMLYSMFRPFLSEELKQRIIFQGELGNLSELVSPTCLPPLFHGSNEAIDVKSSYMNVEKNRHVIERMWQKFKKDVE